MAATKDETHHFLFLFFASILKEGEDEKLQLRQDVCVHINTPLLGITSGPQVLIKKAIYLHSVGLWDKH